MSFVMEVAFMMFVKELRRNGGETVEIRRFFCHFSLNYTFLNHLRPLYFLLKKITQIFLHLTLVIFQISYYSTKKITSVQCKFFEKKNKLGSNNREIYNSARNGKKKSAADSGFRRLQLFRRGFFEVP